MSNSLFYLPNSFSWVAKLKFVVAKSNANYANLRLGVATLRFTSARLKFTVAKLSSVVANLCFAAANANFVHAKFIFIVSILKFSFAELSLKTYVYIFIVEILFTLIYYPISKQLKNDWTLEDNRKKVNVYSPCKNMIEICFYQRGENMNEERVGKMWDKDIWPFSDQLNRLKWWTGPTQP